MGPKANKKKNNKKKNNNQDNGEDSVPPTPIEGESTIPDTPVDGDGHSIETANGATDESTVPDTATDADNVSAEVKPDEEAADKAPSADAAEVPHAAEEAGVAGQGEGDQVDPVDPMQFQEPQQNGVQEEAEEAPQLVSQDTVPDSAAAEQAKGDAPEAHFNGASQQEAPASAVQEAPAQEAASNEPPTEASAQDNPEQTSEQTTHPAVPPVVPPMLKSLTSADPRFSAFRYLSLHSHDFTSRPHHDIDSSYDLDSRNMASSISNWYNKIYTLADSLEFSKGWPVVEAFDHFASALDRPFKQISLWPPEEFFARKPRDDGPEELEGDDLKYENFWEWKSKIALSAFCTNFAAREVMGRNLFAVGPDMVKRLGSAMFVFAKDFEDEVTATKFRQMTIKLLFESTPYKKAVQRELLNLSKELGNVLAPLSMLLPPPSTESSEKAPQPQDPTAALNSMILATVGTPSVILHNTIHKDPVYFALYHPTPGQNFDEDLMEEATFNGMGAGRGDVGFICRPGLIRMGFPKYGESPDIGIVLKARVLREAAIEWEP